MIWIKKGFNPRPRVGGDPKNVSNKLKSICFNPRPRVGGDVICSTTSCIDGPFQSTPPRGGRHGIVIGGLDH